MGEFILKHTINWKSIYNNRPQMRQKNWPFPYLYAFNPCPTTRCQNVCLSSKVNWLTFLICRIITHTGPDWDKREWEREREKRDFPSVCSLPKNVNKSRVSGPGQHSFSQSLAYQAIICCLPVWPLAGIGFGGEGRVDPKHSETGCNNIRGSVTDCTALCSYFSFANRNVLVIIFFSLVNQTLGIC